jgi:four helix bundle protein
MRWFVSLSASRELSGRSYRQIDEGVTSVILNIAEGNGRYSEMDHRRFLEVAASSAVKVAAHLDLAAQKFALNGNDCRPGKALLERIGAMLSRM